MPDTTVAEFTPEWWDSKHMWSMVGNYRLEARYLGDLGRLEVSAMMEIKKLGIHDGELVGLTSEGIKVLFYDWRGEDPQIWELVEDEPIKLSCGSLIHFFDPAESDIENFQLEEMKETDLDSVEALMLVRDKTNPEVAWWRIVPSLQNTP